MATLTNGDLGRAAYEAYSQAVGHRSVHGESLWAWDDLPEPVALAWMCAAVTVRSLTVIEERTPGESETDR